MSVCLGVESPSASQKSSTISYYAAPCSRLCVCVCLRVKKQRGRDKGRQKRDTVTSSTVEYELPHEPQGRFWSEGRDMRQQEAPSVTMCEDSRGGNWGETRGLNSPQWEYTKISQENVSGLQNLCWTAQHPQNNLLSPPRVTKRLYFSLYLYYFPD